MGDTATIAYCGPAAVPGDLLTRWNFDPLLMAALAALAIVIASGRVANARAGWASLVLATIIFVSPLCALSSALFSARVLHHVLLIAAVAPLLALAFPVRRLPSPPLAALVGLHTIILWVWHMPAPYAWGLASVPAYWLMQTSLLVSAWLLWRAIFVSTTQPGPALAALVATTGQMGLLAALIVFAPRPLYVVHFASTAAWGMNPLADQQLGGLLMWVPASLPYLGLGLLVGLVELAASRANRMTTLLKFIHLGTIAIWSGGLIVLPFLFWQRRAIEVGPELDRLHRLTRFVYVGMTSPAAFVAIGSGTALIFLQATFLEWFSLKMVLVGIMVMLHVVAGLTLMHLFEPAGRFSRFSYVALTVAYLVLITAIIGVVLGKPHIDSNQFAQNLFAPGGLRQFLGETKMPIP